MKPHVLVDYHFSVSAGHYTVRALLKLEGRPPARDERVPLNLSLVLDRSGSMAGEKLAAAREAAALLVRRLRPEDTVSVVTFDDMVQTVAPPATGEAQANLPRLIEAVQAGGSTNLSGGWLQGREHVAERLMKGGSNRVLLLTDGQANVGITDPEALVGLCRNAREQGITTSTIGFGTDYDEHLLRRMADAGGGSTYYIETPDQAPGVFEEEIEGLLSLVAQNIVVDVTPGAAVGFTAVHHSYPSQRTDHGVRVQMGDLYAREPRLLLLEFAVPRVDAAEVEIARCRVVSQVLTSDGGVERQEITFPIRHPLAGESHAEPEIEREVLLLGAGRARQAALDAQARGDYVAARGALREAHRSISSSPAPMDATMLEELHDLQAMESQMSASEFSPRDAKYLHQRAYASISGKRGASMRISRVSPRRRMREVTGDALRLEAAGPGPKILACVCNDAGAWGAGFLSQLATRWPRAPERFAEWQAGALSDPPFALGQLLMIPVGPELWIAMLLVQQGTRPENGHPPVRYAAMDAALGRLGVAAARLDAAVHMPRLGTGLAGGSWDLVEPMVQEHLAQRGVEVVVYRRQHRAAASER